MSSDCRKKLADVIQTIHTYKEGETFVFESSLGLAEKLKYLIDVRKPLTSSNITDTINIFVYEESGIRGCNPNNVFFNKYLWKNSSVDFIKFICSCVAMYQVEVYAYTNNEEGELQLFKVDPGESYSLDLLVPVDVDELLCNCV